MPAWFKGTTRKKDVEATFLEKGPIKPTSYTPEQKASTTSVKNAPRNSTTTVQDILGNIMRGFGRFSFDIGTVDNRAFRQRCEQWTRHLLLGEKSPPPGNTDLIEEEEDEEAINFTMDERDFAGAQRFILDRRRMEKQYVESSLDGLKSVVIDSLAGLREIIATDQTADERITKELNNLLEQSKDASAEELRAQAAKTIDLVLNTIKEREKKHQKQISTMHESMSTVREELYEAKRQLKEDPLTEVFNRGAFDQTFEKFMRLATFMNESFCLILIDLDHFKHINDQYGHLAGDTVLKVVAKEIYRNFPRKNDFVSRYGGDEFAVLLSDTQEKVAVRLCERLLARLKRVDFEIDPDLPEITCSIGVVAYDIEQKETAKQIFEQADQALYRSKEAGRACVST